MNLEIESLLETDGGLARRPDTRIHPIVKLDYFVRLLACPLPAVVILSARSSAGDATPPTLWIALALYGIVWPHAAFFLARRSNDTRRTEMRLLLLDAAASGAAIAFASFQTVPTLMLVTGFATILGSVGGVPFLIAGMSILLASMLITAATVTGFAVMPNGTPVSTGLAALALFGFQTMMGLLAYRTARSFVRSRRQIAEQSEEIRRQNEALVEAREEALQAAQAKAAFLATMSHEIRTPLNGVLGMTRLLVDTPLTAEQQDFVGTIQVSGTTLLTVINGILDYSRIESGRLELEQEPFSVRAVVEEALEIVGTHARENGNELVCEVSPDVPTLILGDATRLRQILTNLAGNAVKFTHEGEIVVSVRRLEGESTISAELQFSVRDTGIGIPADRIPLLFAPFSQADASTTRRYGGTGLGLAISRRLTELMGGTISVQSTAGTGSTFSFTIHALLARDERSSPGLSSVQLAGQHVLIVEDNATARRVLCAQLESWGMKPEPAEDAAQAIRALAHKEHFALAILDRHMPDVDGLTLAQRIRQDARYGDLPLILLSSSLVQSKDDPERLFHTRLMKPVRQSKLFDSIVRVLDRASIGGAFERGSSGQAVVPLTTALKILVADDNEVNRKLAGLVFRRLGYEADFAVNGREALDRVVRNGTSDEPYDLVFMDVHMPEMDGLEATRRIRRFQSEQQGKRRTRIVAMTADAMPEDREICLGAGMDDYLTKPLDFDAVRAVLVTAAAGIVDKQAALAAKLETSAKTDSLGVASGAPLIDWSRLDEVRGYDTPEGTVVRDVILSFMKEAPARLCLLRSSAAAHDAQALRASAHALKGAAINVGAIAVADCATRLEEAAKLSAFDRIDVLVENLSTALAPTLSELAGGVRTLSNEATAGPPANKEATG